MQESFVDVHGVKVFTRWWPVDHPRGVVLVAHGASEHSGRYARLADALNLAGLAVAALDHRGHGRTRASTGPGKTGRGGGMALVEDLHELRAAVESEIGDDLPMFVFGHSMGALIALAYLTDHSNDLAGAVLCGMPADVDGASALASTLQAFAEVRDQPVVNLLGDNNAPFEPARTPFDWLSRDEDEVDRYLADPFCGYANPLTYGYLIDLLAVVAPAREHLASISCPILVIAGAQDSAAAMGAHAVTLSRALEAAGVEVRTTIYDDARHELLNDINRTEVVNDIIEWLDVK